MKKIITMTILGLSISTQSFGQDIKTSPVKEIDFEKNQIYDLDFALEKQNYSKFYELINNQNVSANNKIKYLNDKRFEGHIPTYWVMADLYSKTKNARETHKWLYIATILTQQDAALCYDQTAKYASQKLLKSFPSAPDLTRVTPQYINPVMPEVVFFIDNLKNRTSPLWVCEFGYNPVGENANKLLPENNWKDIRRSITETYTKNYNK